MSRDLGLRRLLDRGTFGARPGEFERLFAAPSLARSSSSAAEAARRWIDAQLEAARSPDRDLDRRLAAFSSLALDPEDLPREVLKTQGTGSARFERRAHAMREIRKAVRERSKRIARDVVGARLVRAVHARAGLREVMVDFWSNHFSVFARKHMVGGLLPHYQREVLDRFALGRFEDLLVAVAKSPAMLVYLDNWTSTAPQPGARRRGAAARGSPLRRAVRSGGGINENYARELLELHTLGVSGGYTQEDVGEVARVFTGWSLESLRAPTFAFHASLHDPGRKTVLGERTRGSGIAEGENLLHRLARHPQTARHIATALVRRFVADDPPARLVAETARSFLDTGGEIPAVLKLVLLSPEFADPAHQKLKTPLRYAVGALRATGGETDGGPAVLRELGRMGELPFLARTPAGFPEDAASWIDPGALLERMRFAAALAGDRIRGTYTGGALPGSEPKTASTILDSARSAGPRRSPEGLAHRDRLAVALAAPEFQWT